jgi:hypothetical protein
VWANSDAFEQGAFAIHLLGSPAWEGYIAMSDARTHNAPCTTAEEADTRGALACHFLAEYKDRIHTYVASRHAQADMALTTAGHGHATNAEGIVAGMGTLAAAPSGIVSLALPGTGADKMSGAIGPMVRVFAERVSPYFVLHASPSTTLCHVGAGDGALATQLAARLHAGRVLAVDATVTPDKPDALVQSFNGRELPMADNECDVTLFAYYLHRSAAAHVTPALLAEARRVTRGYVLVAEDRAGRTLKESERNSAVEPHGTFRSMTELHSLLAAADLDVLSSGSMFAPTAPQIFLVAKPR